ncbi:MAG: hypothetical protein ABI041_18670 [Bdellovibrionia bacterium]
MIETLIRYFKRERKEILVKVFLILGISCIIILVISLLPKKEVIKIQETPNPAESITKPSAPLKDRKTSRGQGYVRKSPKGIVNSSLSEEKKSIKNFVNFKNNLISITRVEGYSREFSISLARAIQDNLENDRLSQEDLEKTISHVLGKGSRPGEIEQIRGFVIQAITKTARPYNEGELDKCSQSAMAAFITKHPIYSQCITDLVSKFSRDIQSKAISTDKESIAFLTITSSGLPETIRLLDEKCDISPIEGRSLLLSLWCQPIVEID